MQTALRKPAAVSTKYARAANSAAPRPVVCRAHKEEESARKAVALPLAGLVAAALMTSAVVPEEALAAKSAGRSGGSSGFQARRAAPSRAAAPTQMSSSTTVVAPSVVMAPPVYSSPFGFSPFGGFGFGFAPTIGFGFGLGSFFQIFFLLATVSIIFSVIKGIADAAGQASRNRENKDDDWGKL